MPITTDKNNQYGPPLVNQKYSPLLAPVVNAANQPIYTGMLKNRQRMLAAVGLLGQRLRLATSDWVTVTNAEAGHLPPLVVVSSNRANWIKQGIADGATQMSRLVPPAFTDASDLRALSDAAPGTISPPLYAPSRIGANRNVYVVVHMAEYRFYKSALAGTGITTVGWEFAKGGGAQRGLTMMGFGASRFAAMEFCKYLRRRVAGGGPAPWNAAWLVDDNVVALTNFAGFAAVEAALGANVCAGFRGGTLAESRDTNRALAIRELAAGRGGAALALPPSLPPGIVQQIALWNVQYLDIHHLNFGPAYIASAEDISLTNYFNNAGTPYQFYNGIGVVKEEPTYDNGLGAERVKTAREVLIAWVTAAESANPPGVPPPPIDVLPVWPADGGVQSLSDFITNRVLPAGPLAAQRDSPTVQALAKCHGVEQITHLALNQGFVGANALTATFQVNGGNLQPVQPVRIP